MCDPESVRDILDQYVRSDPSVRGVPTPGKTHVIIRPINRSKVKDLDDICVPRSRYRPVLMVLLVGEQRGCT